MKKIVIVRRTQKTGRGVFSLKDFKKGELIFRYNCGKVVSRKGISKLTKWESDHLDELDNDHFEVMVAPACYVNHSCDPNTIQEGRAYRALKPIKQGDELIVDYRAKGIFKNRWMCKCKGKNCKGYVISDFFSLPKKLQRLYLPYTLKIIKDTYKQMNK
ncbi:MAG: SET domain-containing protein [Nanoarchaeota archaeon]|nr:SET domain-containing protein [Nanoarchaeota archaeon]